MAKLIQSVTIELQRPRGDFPGKIGTSNYIEEAAS
jgi:hypothetical protein